MAFLCVCELVIILLLFILPIVFTAPSYVCEFGHWDCLLRCVADWLQCAYVNIGIICYVGRGRPSVYCSCRSCFVGGHPHAVSASASWLLATFIIYKSLTLYTIITLYIHIQAYRVHSCVSLLVIIHVLLHSCEYANMRIIHHCYLFIFTHIIARSALIIIIAHIYCLLLLLSYHEYHEIYMLLCLFHFLITNHSFWSFLFIFHSLRSVWK